MFRLAVLAILAPALAHAYSYDAFLGWSPDGAYYLYTSAGHDGVEHPVVCASRAGGTPTSWPKKLKPPDDEACVAVCEPAPDDLGQCERLAEAKTWVKLPPSKATGPHGETLSLKIAHGAARVTVSAGGKKLTERQFGEWREDLRPKLLEARWRPDGEAVAVLVGTPEDPSDETPGWPPPRYVAVIPFRDEADANAANVRGMQLLKKKDLKGATAEFKKALAASQGHVLARYNLACAEALAGDRKAAIEELKWLKASDSPAAETALAKAASDPDLRSIVADPEVKKLLPACGDVCEKTHDSCEADCSDDNSARACGRACGMAFDGCMDKCK
jgi:hypothetical protein